MDVVTRQSYLSCVSTMRLLAKFLGLIVFLPYNRPETALPQNVLETEVSLRSKVCVNLFMTLSRSLCNTHIYKIL